MYNVNVFIFQKSENSRWGFFWILLKYPGTLNIPLRQQQQKVIFTILTSVLSTIRFNINLNFLF